jgi:D-alanyl-D-alanine carboxypeptidase (penicillin-binding protein 5/6)
MQKKDVSNFDLAGSGLVPKRKQNCTDLKLWAGSSVAIDVESGVILHYDEGRKQTQIASLTKIMTAILAVENIEDFNEEVIIKKEALNVPGTVVGCPTSVFCNGNRMYVGEKVHAIDLFKAMLLNSANDAATALAIHISGSEDKFVEKMNKKVKDLGLIDTNFCTSSGLEKDGKENECYSSAYDIARIGAASLKYDLIWDTMKITEGQFYSTDGKFVHLLKNTDLLLGNIPNCLGGKTGFTPLAGKALLMGSVDPTGKHKVITVLLNDEKRWDDMKLLLNWVYNNYEWK